MKVPVKNTVDPILERALTGDDLSPAEGITLLKQTDKQIISAIHTTADKLRFSQAGDTVTYIINRNINFTNICEQHCSFCAFRRDDGDEGAFWLNWGQILEKTTDAVKRGATEICMQGGLNPEAKIDGKSLTYYLKLVETIKQDFPHLHLHAFSPQEIQFIAKLDGLTYVQVIAALQEAGVGSMPGTAAEVLDDKVRRILCPEKTNSATWLEIVRHCPSTRFTHYQHHVVGTYRNRRTTNWTFRKTAIATTNRCKQSLSGSYHGVYFITICRSRSPKTPA